MDNIGFRIFPLEDRPAPEMVECFREIPVANLGDNMGRIYCMDAGIRPYNQLRLLGTAFTVKAPAGDNLMFHKAIAMAKPGDILVVDGEGSMCHSLCGEIMMREAVAKGIAGFLIDGCIRDAEALLELPLAVFARGIQPKGPYKNGPGEINVPVAIGGQVVMPGDIIVGDFDGVVAIRPHEAAEMAQKGAAQFALEATKFQKIKEGTLNKSWVDQSLEKGGCEIIG